MNTNSRINPRWMNGLIRRNVKRKYNLYNKYLNSLSVEDHRRYIQMRNECNRVIRMSKRKFESIHFYRKKAKQIQSCFGSMFNPK